MPNGKLKQPQQYELPEDTPEFYIDSVNVETQLYGSTLLLGRLRGSGTPPLVKVVIKLSPPMLKAVSLILSKHVQEYEERIGPIPLPKQLVPSILEEVK